LLTEHGDIQGRREAFGRRVRELRKAKGIKHETLATALSYSARTSISHIERGSEDVPLTKIFAYALELRIEPHELYLDRLPTSDVTDLINRLPQPVRDLLRLWKTLAERERQALQRCLEILAADDRESRRRVTERIDYISTWKAHRGRQRGSGGVGERDTLAG